MTRLALDPLVPDEIERATRTRRLGKKIHYYRTIPSTNSEAYSLARHGAGEGEIVIAEEQTRGKGRLGRCWVSPPYMNLYLSLILRPGFAPARAPQITLMSAVAVAETARAFLPFAPEIKWPNDILVGGKKLAGILTESCCEGDRVLFVVVGIGVNVNFPKDRMPLPLREGATSLMTLARRPVDRMAFISRLIQNLDQCYEDLGNGGFHSIARRWDSFFQLKGKRVRVETTDGWLFGKAIGIDSDGAFLLEDETGSPRRVIAGDVIPVTSES